MTSGGAPLLKVSDHALLRILQRIGGFEIEALRTSIAADLLRAAAATDKVGARDFVVLRDGFRYVVADGVLVTVTEAPRR